MTCLGSKGVFVCAALFLSIQPAAVRAQDLQNSKVEITYEEPKKSEHLPILQRLQKRQVLEQLRAFLSPLRLPKKMPIKTTECGVINAFWAGTGKGLSLCYEYLYYLEDRVAKAEMPPGYQRADALVGGFLGVTFHELGHAVFDILDVPVYGREEDAADQMAGFILQQFGPTIARRMVSGAAHLWL